MKLMTGCTIYQFTNHIMTRTWEQGYLQSLLQQDTHKNSGMKVMDFKFPWNILL